MGNKVPIADERMQKTIDMLRLKKQDVRRMWKCFRKHDKDKSGSMDIDEFYRMIREKRSVFGDSLFELIDCDNSGTLDFSEFVAALGTYCMFGKIDVLKYCFYIFDKDKNGYIEDDELQALISLLQAGTTYSNHRIALQEINRWARDQKNNNMFTFYSFCLGRCSLVIYYYFVFPFRD